MDDSDVLDEYYRNKKSHLTPEERSFLLEDKVLETKFKLRWENIFQLNYLTIILLL